MACFAGLGGAGVCMYVVFCMGLYRGVVSGLESEHSGGPCDGNGSGESSEFGGIYAISPRLENRWVRVTKGSYEQQKALLGLY